MKSLDAPTTVEELRLLTLDSFMGSGEVGRALTLQVHVPS